MIRNTETENGRVRGIEAADPRITAFKGVPFAAPPINERRWQPPMPAENWEGVLDCFRFKPIAMQDTPGIGDNVYIKEWHVDSDIEMSEDCLYLNIWTGARSTKEKLPVMVWFFGGALQWGYPSEMEFDGERIARRGIIVVLVNYRLGVFGFLAHPELTATQPEAPSNFGSLDQQAGLDWVIRNISNFGGDPENITIAGQSAGGGSVMAQMACPANKGKFKRAIVESAMIRSPYGDTIPIVPKPISEVEKLGTAFFEYAGINSLEEGRSLPALYIREKYSEFYKTHDFFYGAIDKKFMLGDPTVMFYENKRNIVPVLAGNTSDEFPNYIKASSDNEFREKVRNLYGDDACRFLEMKEAWNKAADDLYAPAIGIENTVKKLFLSSNEKNKNTDSYYYRFDIDMPGDDNAGNFHSCDLWFFFETLAKCWRPFTGKYYDLSRQMCNYWANFIKSGNPNGNDIDGKPMPEWKPYTKENQFSIVFNEKGIYAEKKDSDYVSFLTEHMIIK